MNSSTMNQSAAELTKTHSRSLGDKDSKRLQYKQCQTLRLTGVAEGPWVTQAELGGKGLHHSVNLLCLSWQLETAEEDPAIR